MFIIRFLLFSAYRSLFMVCCFFGDCSVLLGGDFFEESGCFERVEIGARCLLRERDFETLRVLSRNDSF